VVTDLAGTQISSLMETLPGIAQVLRSPVADALINALRAASGQGTMTARDADELMRFAVRRNLLSVDESERVLAEVTQALNAQAASVKPAKATVKATAKVPTRASKASAKPARAAAKAKVPARKAAKRTASARTAARKKPARAAKTTRPARVARKK
jgi:hypothetical protein